MLGSRNVIGLPLTDIFVGNDVDELIRIFKTAVRERQSIKTDAILASVEGDHNANASRIVHTIVPINDSEGTSVHRVFIYSEKSK